MRQREDNDGSEERCVKIDTDSKKTNGSKSLKEMKEYLRSEFEKKTYRSERRIRSFVTFHGIFMGPGYDLGARSIWRKMRHRRYRVM